MINNFVKCFKNVLFLKNLCNIIYLKVGVYIEYSRYTNTHIIINLYC